MAPYELDSDDGQILVEGFHDSNLVGISTPEDGVVELLFKYATPQRPIKLLVTVKAERLRVWGSGIILPNVVGCLVVDSGPERKNLARILSVDDKLRFEQDLKIYGCLDWALGIDTAVGGPYVVFASGTFDDCVTITRLDG